MVDNNEKCGKIELGGACFGFIVDFPKDFICSIDYENEMFVFGDEFEVDVSGRINLTAKMIMRLKKISGHTRRNESTKKCAYEKIEGRVSALPENT